MDTVSLIFLTIIIGFCLGMLLGLLYFHIKYKRCSHENVTMSQHKSESIVRIHCEDCGKTQFLEMDNSITKVFATFTGIAVRVTHILDKEANKMKLSISKIED